MTGRPLAGKVALVTGGSRGIGRAIALRLADDGAIVAIHYNGARAAAEDVQASITRAGGTAFVVQADLSHRSGPTVLTSAFTQELIGRFGVPDFDILVNNAGAGKRVTIEHISEDDFDHILTVNLRSPFFLIQSLLPQLRQGGRIINVSSMGVRAAYPEMPAYAPAKAGLESLTRLLAVHVGHRGITVNAVRPGATATDMNKGARDPEIALRIAETVALGRVGQPEDISRIVAFLASPESGWITGQEIDASGGQRL